MARYARPCRAHLSTSHAACMASVEFDVLDADAVPQPGRDRANPSQGHGYVATCAPLLDRPCL